MLIDQRLAVFDASRTFDGPEVEISQDEVDRVRNGLWDGIAYTDRYPDIEVRGAADWHTQRKSRRVRTASYTDSDVVPEVRSRHKAEGADAHDDLALISHPQAVGPERNTVDGIQQALTHHELGGRAGAPGAVVVAHEKRSVHSIVAGGSENGVAGAESGLQDEGLMQGDGERNRQAENRQTQIDWHGDALVDISVHANRTRGLELHGQPGDSLQFKLCRRDLATVNVEIEVQSRVLQSKNGVSHDLAGLQLLRVSRACVDRPGEAVGTDRADIVGPMPHNNDIVLVDHLAIACGGDAVSEFIVGQPKASYLRRGVPRLTANEQRRRAKQQACACEDLGGPQNCKDKLIRSKRMH